MSFADATRPATLRSTSVFAARAGEPEPAPRLEAPARGRVHVQAASQLAPRPLSSTTGSSRRPRPGGHLQPLLPLKKKKVKSVRRRLLRPGTATRQRCQPHRRSVRDHPLRLPAPRGAPRAHRPLSLPGEGLTDQRCGTARTTRRKSSTSSRATPARCIQRFSGKFQPEVPGLRVGRAGYENDTDQEFTFARSPTKNEALQPVRLLLPDEGASTSS